MAIQLKNTKDYHLNGIKVLVYGQAGAGKTCLIPTLPNPVVISVEGGLLSISEANIPYIAISTIEELQEAYEYVKNSDYQSIALDSISEIAEVILNSAKKTVKDPRQAYGEMQEKITDIIRMFRDIEGKHIYFSAKLEKTQDETGKILNSPSMPGNKVGQSLPYFFDEVFALRVEKDEQGNNVRVLQTNIDGIWQAKDRSGKLDMYEKCDLSEIIKKIGGV
jgi:phage nucleotide-binding protein